MQDQSSGRVAIRALGLTKIFGTLRAVDSVDLEIRTGEVFGFLGPNGAGKTTTINMILGLISPTAGQVEILGQPAPWSNATIRRHIGSLPDGVQLYPYLSARENLSVFARMLGDVPARRIDEVLDLIGLVQRAKDRVGGYSHGMKRRLALALALLHDPEILVLDEPANGLDPAGIKEMRDLMKALAAQGKAIFLSSHLLHEVEIICDKVAILKRGTILAQGRVEELLRQTPAIEMMVHGPDIAEEILQQLPEVKKVKRNGKCLVIEYVSGFINDMDMKKADDSGQADSGRSPSGGAPRASTQEEEYSIIAGYLNAVLVSHGVFAYEIRPKKRELEEIFFDVTKEETNVDGRIA